MIKSRFKALSFIICILYILFIIPIIQPQIVFAETTSDGFTYTVSGSTATITGYTGPGGDITIPSTISNGVFDYTVTSIGDGAFWNGYNLTSVTIPNSITSIGNGAFLCCYSLTNVTIPSSVKSIGDRAFYYCSSFTSVIIPSSVTTIGDSAFESCWRVTSVTIPNSVTSIGDNGFFSCYNLTNVTIPKSVNNIGIGAFGGCDKLTSIEVDSFNEYYSSIDGILFNKSASAIIACPGGKSGIYIIPDSVDSIGDRAFYDCNSLTSVTIPNSVTSIGESAFYHINNLMNVTIPKGVISIGLKAFGSCCNLKSIAVDSSNGYYSSINGALFNKSADLIISYPAGIPETSYIIPDSVISIGEYAFDSCWQLTSVTIPNSVTQIRSNGFNHCYNITSVTIPDSVTSVGDSAFYECGKLTNLTIGSGVKSISNNMFQFCESLTSVTIPDSVTNIGSYAFNYCSKLTQVQFLGNAPAMDSSAFSQCSSNLRLYYLCDKTGFTNPWYGYETLKIGIEVTNPPLKTNYVVGESLDTNGLVVTGYYYGGTSGIIPISMVEINGFDSSIPIKGQVVTVGANGRTATFTVDIFAKTYTVTFNSNGGSDIANQTVNYNEKVTIPENPNKAGYTFDGWYKDAGYINEYDFSTLVTSDTTLYAKWTAKSVAGVSLDKTTANLKIGESTNLAVTVNPTDVLNKNVTWSSSNTSVAIVDNTGKVSAIGKGTATITVNTIEGGYTANCIVNVEDRNIQVISLIGSSRYDTAVKLSQSQFTTTDTIIIVNGGAMADGLGATPLAKYKNASLLLTETKSLPDSTVNEIKRLKAKKAIIVGGTGVVSDNVKLELQALGLTVERISGSDRYGTSLEVAKYIDKNCYDVSKIVVSNGYGEADALSIAAVAGRDNMPIILVDKDNVPTAIYDWLNSENIENAYIIGGTGVVSNNVLNQIAAVTSGDISNNRLGGQNRFETNSIVIDKFYGSFIDKTYIAKGYELIDALAAGPVAAINGSPVVLSDNDLDMSQKTVIGKRYGNTIIRTGGGISNTSVNSLIQCLQ